MKNPLKSKYIKFITFFHRYTKIFLHNISLLSWTFQILKKLLYCYLIIWLLYALTFILLRIHSYTCLVFHSKVLFLSQTKKCGLFLEKYVNKFICLLYSTPVFFFSIIKRECCLKEEILWKSERIISCFKVLESYKACLSHYWI